MNLLGGRNNTNITALQINNLSYYLVGFNYEGNEVIVERGSCQITRGMIMLMPDDGNGGMKEVRFNGGKTLVMIDLYYGYELAFTKK